MTIGKIAPIRQAAAVAQMSAFILWAHHSGIATTTSQIGFPPSSKISRGSLRVGCRNPRIAGADTAAGTQLTTPCISSHGWSRWILASTISAKEMPELRPRSLLFGPTPAD
jgi:hypothetical protein